MEEVMLLSFRVRPGKPRRYHGVVHLQGNSMDLTRTLDFEKETNSMKGFFLMFNMMGLGLSLTE